MGLGSTPVIGSEPDAVSAEFGLAANAIPLLVALGDALPGNWPQKPRRQLVEVLQLV